MEGLLRAMEGWEILVKELMHRKRTIIILMNLNTLSSVTKLLAMKFIKYKTFQLITKIF